MSSSLLLHPLSKTTDVFACKKVGIAELLLNDYVYILIRVGFSFALDSGAETQYNLPNGWLL